MITKTMTTTASMKNQLVIVALIVTALLGGAFYWYEWRPSQIKKECHEVAKRLEKNAQYERTLRDCFNERGL